MTPRRLHLIFRTRRSLWSALLAAIWITACCASLGVVPEAHATPATPATLDPGGSLSAGQRLTSPNGEWVLTLADNGNARVINAASNHIVWATHLSPLPGVGDHLDLRSDGDLVLCTAAGTVRWSSGTTAELSDHLELTDTGTLEIRSKGDLLLWSNADNSHDARGTLTANRTNTLGAGQTMSAAQSLWSSDLVWKLGIDANCRIAISRVADATVVWTSPNAMVAGGCAATGYITEQTDGNFAIFQNPQTPLWWSSQTPVEGGAAVLGTDGRLGTFSASGLARWTSPDPTGMATTTAAPAPGTSLNYGSSMTTAAQLTSANGLYVAKLSATCRLVVTAVATHAVEWSSPNAKSSRACILQVGSSGDVQITYPGATSPLWNAGVAYAYFDRLILRNNGVLALMTMGGIDAWTTKLGVTGGDTWTLGVGQSLRTGQFLLSANGNYEATMQSDGNFVVCTSASVHCISTIWSTQTQGNAGAYFTIRRSDSNLVVFDAQNHWKWASFTSGDIGDHLVMQDDGNLGFYGPAGALWGWKNGIIWTFPKSVGVYAYPDPQSNVMGDGWGILGITGGLSTTSNPWVDVSENFDMSAGMAIQTSGRRVPWMSYWTVSGGYTQPTLLGDPCATQNAAPISSQSLAYGVTGYLAGQAVAHKIDGYAASGLHLKPDYVILDPEGYPDYNSGFTCRTGAASSADTPNFTAMIRGWVAGITSIDPTLTGAFYANQSQFAAFNAAHLQTAAGASIPGFLAVAFGASNNPSSPLVAPTPISSSIPYGRAAVANSDLKGIIAFYAGVPFSVECSAWTGVAAQVLDNWGTSMNTLQFDPGRSCTPSGTAPR